jgi:hypothetical protein
MWAVLGMWAVLVTTSGLLSLIWTARAARRKPEVAPAGKVVTGASLDIASAAVAAQISALSTMGMYYAFLNQLALLRGTIDRETGKWH